MNKGAMMIIGFLVVLLAGLLVISIAYNRGGEKMQRNMNGDSNGITRMYRKSPSSGAMRMRSNQNVPMRVNLGDGLVRTQVRVR